VTIDGTNFSPSLSKQIVKVDNIDCIVKEASEDQLVCQIERTPYFSTMSDVDALFQIYLGATTTTATYKKDMIRNYKFTTPEASISDVATSFDTSLNKLKLTLTGTGFDAGDLTAVKVLIDGVLQETISVTATEA